MITTSTQSWAVGATVRVGFLSLIVTGLRGDGTYELENKSGDKFYDFVPYRGLVRL